jgi:hypothetical protein
VTLLAHNAFDSCYSIETVDAPLATRVGEGVFKDCYSLKSVSIPNAKTLERNAFNDNALYSLVIPEVLTLASSYPMCSGNGAIEIDFSKITTLPSKCLQNNRNLVSLILRGDTKVTLENIDALSGTPIENNFGWIYVPANLVSTYKADSKWSTYASNIVSIEEYPKVYDGGCTITDTWEEIFASEDDGTYITKYSIGDTKFAMIENIPIRMQIAKFDGDDLSDGTGKAKITWVCESVSMQKKIFSPSKKEWAASELHQYLNGYLYSNIETVVRNRIKTVSKTYNRNNSISNDNIWLLSCREMGINGYETSGVVYNELFTDNLSKRKFVGILGQGIPVTYMLRSTYVYNSGGYGMTYITSTGQQSYNEYHKFYLHYAYGFCT